MNTYSNAQSFRPTNVSPDASEFPQAAAMHEVRVSNDNSSEAVSEAQGAHMVERVDHMEVCA